MNITFPSFEMDLNKTHLKYLHQSGPNCKVWANNWRRAYLPKLMYVGFGGSLRGVWGGVGCWGSLRGGAKSPGYHQHLLLLPGPKQEKAGRGYWKLEGRSPIELTQGKLWLLSGTMSPRPPHYKEAKKWTPWSHSPPWTFYLLNPCGSLL